MKRWLSFALCAMLALSAPASGEEAAQTLRTEAADGTIRVMLQSLGGQTQALGLTLDGEYTVNGDRGFWFARGASLSVGVDGGNVVLSDGEMTIEMGGGFTLTRHQPSSGAEPGGIYIHETGARALYRGDLSISARNGGLRVIAILSIEEYLYGVVPYEMSDTFPLEALKAQAVAARSYALQRARKNAGEEYDVVDTTQDQVFRGYDARYLAPIQAVDETRGIVGMNGSRVAELFYTASNGGQTALATDVWGNEGDFPYLAIKDDPYDVENPQSVVKTALVPSDGASLPEALQALLSQKAGGATVVRVKNLQAAEPIYGGGSRQYGVLRFTLETLPGEDALVIFSDTDEDAPKTSETTVDLAFYAEARAALGVAINSSPYELVEVQPTEGGFAVTARRYGHGVGLSQRGAQQMAGQYGMTYLDILRFYYPGLELVRLEWTDAPLSPVAALPESLGYAAPMPTPAPTPGPLPALAEGEYYATVAVAGVDSTLNVRQEPSLSARILGVLRNGARLIVMEEIDGFAHMKTAEMEGYVSMSFIVREE